MTKIFDTGIYCIYFFKGNNVENFEHSLVNNRRTDYL